MSTIKIPVSSIDPAIKPLVKTILQQADHYEWTLQGLGMLRLYLGKERRLHVWSDEHRVEGVSDLHTHPWHLSSQIVAGRMVNQRFVEVGELEQLPGHEHSLGESALMPGMLVCACGVSTPMDDGRLLDFNKVRITCGANACTTGPVSAVKLLPQELETYVEGQSYRQNADEIHRSTPERGTVSIITRRFLDDTEHANVYWRGDGGWVDAAPRPATPEEVRAITRYALERWF